MKPIKPIHVEVPTSEARRERVEREVFARLDAMRDIDHSNAIAPVRVRRPMLLAAGFVAVAAAASLFFVVTRNTPAPQPTTPSLVVTPAGGSSRFTVGDSVIDAGSDTSVEVKQDKNGTTTLTLARGSVDCDVMPRPNRPPFRVIAGDVTVEVVGTRFEVSRTGNLIRVDVSRGKVKVHGNGEQRMLEAGESWASAQVAIVTPPEPARPAVVEPQKQPAQPEQPEIEPARPAKPIVQITPEQAWKAALATKDETRRARAYRTVANGNHTWAALSLFNLAELQAKTDVGASLATLDELKRRFPNAGNAEDAAWLRVEVLRDARRTDEAKQAATEYLEAFPSGTYAKLAQRLKQ
jgi:hypothetical protein